MASLSLFLDSAPNKTHVGQFLAKGGSVSSTRLAKFLQKIKGLQNGGSIALFSQGYVLRLANKERTFIMVKPDGVQRGLVGKIIERFEQKGFKLVALKFTWVSG